MNPFSDVFTEIAVILVIAGTAGALALRYRQPLILAFILVGVLLGPAGLDWVHSHDQVDLFAKLGIAMILFVVGLKLDPYLIHSTGLVAVAVGLGQVILTALLGGLFALALGFDIVTALYIGMGLTFSSTIIIVKLLTDKKELDSLHGNITLGILIIQDIVVVVLMIAISAFSGEGGDIRAAEILLKGVAFLLLIGVIAHYLLPFILQRISHSRELLILFAIAWAMGLASLATNFGLSREVGAFLAGVALASTPYRAILSASLTSMLNFFLLFFFIDLGVTIDMAHLGAEIAPALLLSLFVLLGKPLIVMALLGIMGYTRHTIALSSISLGQISEFSLILVAMGISMGHIEETAMGVITLIALITIGASSYMIIHAHLLYRRFSSWFGLFERQISKHKAPKETQPHVPVDAIVFGMGRYGGSIAMELRQRGLNVMGVDFNPEVVDQQRKKKLLTVYGDVEDLEFPHELPLKEADWIVSTISSQEVSLILLHGMKHHDFQGRIVLTAHNMEEVNFLKQSGADIVLQPFSDAAMEAAKMMAKESERLWHRRNTMMRGKQPDVRDKNDLEK